MKPSRRDFFLLSLVLVAILGLAAALRFYNLAGQSLWSDEGNSAALAGRSFAQIAIDAGRDIHPPLYYWLLHIWTGAFGTGEIALRSLSAVLGVLLVLVIADLGRRLYGETTGLIAALIAAVAPFQVYYSQEARMYMLLALLAATSFLCFWLFLAREHERMPPPSPPNGDLAGTRAPHDGPGRTGRISPGEEGRSGPHFWPSIPGAALLVAWVLGLYTHYLFPALIAMQAALYLLWLVGTWRRAPVLPRLLRFGSLLLLALLCFGPWLPTAIRQATSWPTAGSTMSTPQALETALAYLSFGPTLQAGGARSLGIGTWQVWAFAALAAVGAIPWRALLSMFVPSTPAGTGSSADSPLPSPIPRSPSPTPHVPAQPAAVLVPLGAVPQAGRRSPEAQLPAPPAVAPVPTLREEPGRAGRERAGSLSGQGSVVDRPSRPGARAWYWVRWLGLVGWALGPLAAMLALGLFRESYLKFLLAASPAYTLLMARGIAGPYNAADLWARRREATTGRPAAVPMHLVVAAAWALLILALVVAVSAGAVSSYFTDPQLARDDYRGIAQFLVATAQPDDAILLDAPGQAEVFSYYYHGVLPVYPLPRQRPLDPPATLAELERLASYKKLYVLYWAAEEGDPDRVIQNWLDNRGYKTLDQWRGNVRLAVYVMPEQGSPDETVDNLNLQLGSTITLLGYRAWNLVPHAGEVTQLQLIWRSNQAPNRRYKVFLQLLDPRDQVIAQRDAEPGGESRPTTGWRPGETILDNHGLLIPPGTPPGAYRRIVGLYDIDTMQRLQLPGGADHIDLPPITVARAVSPPPLAALDMQFSQGFDFGGVRLLGHDHYKRGFKHAPDTPLYPGDRLHLSLYWQAAIQPRADWWFDMTLSDNSGHVVAELTAPLVGPNYSTTLWRQGEIVRGEHDLVLPPNLAPATYRLSLTMLPDTNTPAGSAYLGTVTVSKPAK